jgi:hypothetical protein
MRKCLVRKRLTRKRLDALLPRENPANAPEF